MKRTGSVLIVSTTRITSNDRTKGYLLVSPDGNCRLPCVGSHLTLIELPSMLVFNSLFMHLVFSHRILVTGPSEVDEVPLFQQDPRHRGRRSRLGSLHSELSEPDDL